MGLPFNCVAGVDDRQVPPAPHRVGHLRGDAVGAGDHHAPAQPVLPAEPVQRAARHRDGAADVGLAAGPLLSLLRGGRVGGGGVGPLVAQRHRRRARRRLAAAAVAGPRRPLRHLAGDGAHHLLAAHQRLHLRS